MDPVAFHFLVEVAIYITASFACAAIGYTACWLRHRKDVPRAMDRVWRSLEDRNRV